MEQCLHHKGWLARCFFGASAVFLAVLVACTTAIFVPVHDDESEPPYCTVYNHLVKSGGTSIKLQLMQSSAEEHSRRPGLCTSDGSTAIGECYSALHNSSVIMGYGELLRNPLRDIGRECDWFTMMRHPIDQIVSAFYYCPGHDIQRRPLKWCGDAPDQPGTLRARLLEFAREKWINMTYRQMLHSIFCQPTFKLCPPHLMRDRYSRPYHINTTESRETLSKIEGIMLTYTAVGLMSEWELSMQLFDATIKSPVRKWNHHETHNPGSESPEREALLKWAHVDPELRSILAADLLLYSFGVLIFKHQTTTALGTVWD